jgi:hypothetical protein
MVGTDLACVGAKNTIVTLYQGADQSGPANPYYNTPWVGRHDKNQTKVGANLL